MSHRQHGGRRQERVDPRELQLVYENCTRQEQAAVENLYKGKWGVRSIAQSDHPTSCALLQLAPDWSTAPMQVNNLDIRPDALQRHLGQLFTAEVWQDDEMIKTKGELNASKDKMDDIPLQYVARWPLL